MGLARIGPLANSFQPETRVAMMSLMKNFPGGLLTPSKGASILILPKPKPANDGGTGTGVLASCAPPLTSIGLHGRNGEKLEVPATEEPVQDRMEIRDYISVSLVRPRVAIERNSKTHRRRRFFPSY